MESKPPKKTRKNRPTAATARMPSEIAIEKLLKPQDDIIITDL
jgi:hypothetical protein